MPSPRQREWIIDFLEPAPTIVFLALWRSGVVETEVAGWIGALLAAAILVGFKIRRLRFNPILLGMNLHLLVITPTISAAFRLGAAELGQLLLATAASWILVIVLAVGLVMTLFSPRGFIASDQLSPGSRRSGSLILLAATAVAIPWSFFHAGQTIVSIVIPLTALFALRRFLIARALDREGSEGNGAPMAAVLPAIGSDPG